MSQLEYAHSPLESVLFLITPDCRDSSVQQMATITVMLLPRPLLSFTIHNLFSNLCAICCYTAKYGRALVTLQKQK